MNGPVSTTYVQCIVPKSLILPEADRRRTQLLNVNTSPINRFVRHSSQRSRARHRCTMGDCPRDFSRMSDMERHCRTVHNLALMHYHCTFPNCRTRNRRLDHLRAHCRRLHGQLPGLESVEQVSDVEALEDRRFFPNMPRNDGTVVDNEKGPDFSGPSPDLGVAASQNRHLRIRNKRREKTNG